MLLLLPGMACGSDETTAPSADPFAAAAVTPRSVSFYLHLDHAAELRGRLAPRPIAAWFSAIVADGQLRHAWMNLAERAKMEPARLFDTYLGRRLTVLSREEQGVSQWALLSEVDPADSQALYLQLRPRLHGPRAGIPIVESPEDALLLARHGSLLIAGPAGSADLFYEVLEHLAGERPVGESLASDPAVARAGELGFGQAGVLLRHAPPLGGCSTAVARLEADQIEVRQAGRYESAPLSRPVTALRCDFSPLAALERKNLIAMMEPADVGGGLLEAYVATVIGEPLITEELARHLGPRRIIVIGDVEGRTLEQPVDVLSTTLAVCLELKQDQDFSQAMVRLDHRVLKLTNRLNELGEGAFFIEPPAIAAGSTAGAREIDLRPAAEWLTGGLPVVRNLALTWTVANGPHGAWYVIATDRRHLKDVAESLGAPATEPGLVGRFDSVGTADGVRIGQHLTSWGLRAELFTDPPDEAAFRDTMELFGTFAGGIERCRWTLDRPARNDLRVDVQLLLRKPPSAEARR